MKTIDTIDTIDKLIEAAKKLRVATGGRYVSASVEVRSHNFASGERETVAVEYTVYCENTETHQGETLEDAVNAALAGVAPEKYRQRAVELRRQADLLEAKANARQPADAAA